MAKEQTPFEAFACAVLTHVPRANGVQVIQNPLVRFYMDWGDAS